MAGVGLHLALFAHGLVQAAKVDQLSPFLTNFSAKDAIFLVLAGSGHSNPKAQGPNFCLSFGLPNPKYFYQQHNYVIQKVHKVWKIDDFFCQKLFAK